MAAHNSNYDDVLRNLEREILKKVLSLCDTQAEAAKVFGVDPNTLHQRVSGYGLNDKPLMPLGLSLAVVSRSGYLIGMLDQDGFLDGVHVPELGKWLKKGTVRMVAGKDATDLVKQGVALPVTVAAMGV